MSNISNYTTIKRGKKRFFYRNGLRIAFYDVEERLPDTLHANIYLDGGKFNDGSPSLGVSDSNFEKYGVDKIKWFLAKYFKMELAELMTECLRLDLVSGGRNRREMVVF